MTTNLLLAIGVAVLELVMYFFFRRMGDISEDKEYLLMFFVMPSGINLGLCLVGNLLLKYLNCTEIIKNYIPIYVLTLICFTTSTVHNIFQASFCTFAIPILMTVMYGNKKMTRIILILSFLLQQLACYITYLVNPDKQINILLDAIPSGLIVVAAYVYSAVLLRYENQKYELFSQSILRQVELQEQLLTDSLTSLYNLRAFRGVLDQLVEEAEVGNKEIILAVIDIDDFKKINDDYGHEEGNIVLARLGRILRELCGEEGVPARYGGEEFAVLFQDIDAKEAVKRMQKVLTLFSETGFPGLDGKKVTFSCGIVEYKKGQSSHDFFSRADKAMYYAKRQGKNNVMFDRRINLNI